MVTGVCLRTPLTWPTSTTCTVAALATRTTPKSTRCRQPGTHSKPQQASGEGAVGLVGSYTPLICHHGRVQDGGWAINCCKSATVYIDGPLAATALYKLKVHWGRKPGKATCIVPCVQNCLQFMCLSLMTCLHGPCRIHNKPVSKMWEWTAVPSVPVEASAMLPSSSNVKITLNHGVQMITFVNTVPIDENRAINRFCLIRNFALSPAFDFWARR